MLAVKFSSLLIAPPRDSRPDDMKPLLHYQCTDSLGGGGGEHVKVQMYPPPHRGMEREGGREGWRDGERMHTPLLQGAALQGLAST